jgi:hypothetical protein
VTPRGPAAERLEPPSYFNAAELAEWHQIVDRMDADFFPRESRVLVVSYISVSVALDHVNRKLSTFEGVPQTKDLLKTYYETRPGETVGRWRR